MKRILISLLAAFALCLCATAQVPADLYYVIFSDHKTKLINASDGTCIFEQEGGYQEVAIDNRHNVYTIDHDLSFNSYTVYKNGKVYQELDRKSKKQYYTSMTMTVVGNDVVVAGVESREFNEKGFESRLVGFVNGELAYQTEWLRKSLKRGGH